MVIYGKIAQIEEFFTEDDLSKRFGWSQGWLQNDNIGMKVMNDQYHLIN